MPAESHKTRLLEVKFRSPVLLRDDWCNSDNAQVFVFNIQAIVSLSLQNKQC
jgi:hypothetical protein